MNSNQASYAFNQLESYRLLKDLAAKPVDLTSPDVFTPFRLEKYVAKAVDLTMLYATERVNDDVLIALSNLAQETDCLHKMQRMQNGEVINKIEGYPSENRKVLHTATRDFFDDQNLSPAAKEAKNEAYAEIEKLENFLNVIEKKSFTDLVMVGIGGSDLGPRAHYIAMEYLLKKNRKVHFISNVDPDDAASVLKGLNLSKTLVVCISKSGNTLETETNEAIVKSYFLSQKLDPKEHFVAVTGKGSPMDDPSKYLQSFYIWDWIGGRYSTTSMVGAVMLSFAFGLDVFMEFLKGAHDMDRVALQKNVKDNLPLLGALIGIWNRNFLNYPTLAVIPYCQALAKFPAHIQQLDMESNGKQIDRFGKKVDYQTGPIIWGEPGTNAQHSFFQLIHQGTATIPLEFIGFKESQNEKDLLFKGSYSQEKLIANLFAQSIALASGQKNESNPNKNFAGNRPSHIILGKKLSPYTLGALLSYFENKVAFQGFVWNINSFDQEGVQLGKLLANKIIDQFVDARENKKTAEFPLGEALLKQLNNL